MLRDLLPFAYHLAGRKRPLLSLFVLGLVGAAVALSTPLVGKAFIDAVATRRDFGIVPKIAAGLVALSLLDLVFATLSRRIHARLSAEVLADLRTSLFSRCVEGPLDAAEAFRHGDLLTRFGSDVPRIQTLLVDGLLGSIQNLLFLAVAAAITFHLSPALSLWSFAGLALALVFTSAFRKPVERRTGRVRNAMVDLSHFLSERLLALRQIRLHRTEGEELDRLRQASGRLTREVVGFQVLDSLSAGLPGLILTFSLAWIYLWGGRLLEAGDITLGTFVAFVLYQGRLFAPAQGLLGLVRSLQESRVSVDRVVELMGSETQPAPGAGVLAGELPSAAALELRNVSFSYPGKLPVLRDASFLVKPGERIALFGASGAGKSTVVQLLFGLRQPAEGSVWVEGERVQTGRRRGVGAALGYAGSEPFLVHGSVEENLRYGNPDVSRGELEHAAVLADADGFVRSLPEGYRTVIGGRGLALSDGQRQRLGLARLFLLNPRILVLDEAFSGLDLETEARVRRNLGEAFPHSTSLVISHRPVGLEEFHRIFFLRQGRLVTVTPAELRTLLAPEQPTLSSWSSPVAKGGNHVSDTAH